MKLYYSIVVIGLILLSCNQKKLGELSEYLVDTEQNISLLLSEITEEVAAVELELTDKSMINPDFIRRILIAENNIIIAESNVGGSSKILVFNKNGKFVHSIGAKGQGPGEFNVIQNIAFDESTKRLFIVNFGPNKIICYHLDGKFLKESLLNRNGLYWDINYINDKLFVEGLNSNDGKHAKRILYCMDVNLQITDSIVCWENYYEHNFSSAHYFPDFIAKRNTLVYVYSSEVYQRSSLPEVKVLRNTLYRLEDKQLIPELKLKFRNDGFDRFGNKIIDLYNIFRSSRYVFAIYQINPNNSKNRQDNKTYHFCYDTKTGKGYNMLDGYTDDINGIEERVFIRPLHTDSDIFYYWHTNMKPDDREEPNPTLYIIKLKKQTL